MENINNIKLVAIDIDDTLLNDDKCIPKKNIDEIKRVTAKGVKVILSSGRPLATVTIDLYKQLGLYSEGNYYVAYNGESVYDIYTKECLYSNSLDYNDISYLEKHFNILDKNIARYVHLDENVTVINPNKYSYIEYTYNLKDYIIGNFNKFKNIKAHKYQLAGDPEIIKEIFDEIPIDLKEKYSVVISMPCFIEFMKKGVNKYQGILKVCDKIEISQKFVLAIGDSMNDYSMIKNASIGVAMDNANPEIKKIAKIITKSNNQAGVGLLLEKMSF